ncbi:hypothetical protein [Luteolibacter sp. Populi]|uniref:hypothetical protein n=1 Tax=Luteolibacter sp. Populi TaxID=3230487 RepID=UPI00346777B9
MHLLLTPLAFVAAVLSTGCIVRETVTEHGEVVSDKLKVEEPFEKPAEPEL